MLPVAEIYAYAYSLMPNHFHLLVSIKTQQEPETAYLQKKRKHFSGCSDSMPAFVMQQFSNGLNGYVKAFNKRYGRRADCSWIIITRTAVNKDADIPGFVFYIHKNAVHHGFKKRIGEWTFDSYRALIQQDISFLKYNDVIEYFGSLEALVRFHDKPVKSYRSVWVCKETLNSSGFVAAVLLSGVFISKLKTMRVFIFLALLPFACRLKKQHIGHIL